MSGRTPGPPPPPDGLGSAFRVARQRRLRAAGIAAGSPVVVLVAVLAFLNASPLGDRGADSLVTAPTPSATPVPTATPSAVAPSPTEPGTASRAPSASGTAVAQSSPEPSEAPPPPAPSPPTRERSWEPVHRDFVPSTPCTPPANRETGWCLAFAAVDQGSWLVVRLTVCPTVTNTLPRLVFRTAQEVEIRATSAAGREVWRWSAHQVFAQTEHTVEIPPDRCVRWRTTYAENDDDGARLAAGEYRLHMRATATDTDANEERSATFTVE